MDVEELKREMRAGVEMVRRGRLDPPPASAPIRRFAWGIALVPGIIALVLAHPPTRRRYLRSTWWQAAAALVGAGLYLWLFDSLPDVIDHRDGALVINFKKGEAFWSSAYVTLCVVEWFVIALARDHHDDLSFRASLLAGVPPEDPVPDPRVRLDVGWMWRKLKRRIHGLVIFLCGVPVLAFLVLLPVGDELYAVALALWAAWWLVVFTVGKTAHAWPSAPMPDPWFLRAFTWASQRTSLLRWWLPRAFFARWRSLTGAALKPAWLVEHIPWESAGLGVVRALGSIPGVYLFVRPFIPVAATFALHHAGLTSEIAAPPGAGSASSESEHAPHG